MIALGPSAVLSTFVLFCRIGACLMIMPGFSSPRIPVNVRLFVAIGVTLAMAPMLLPPVQALVPDESPGVLVPLVVSELLIGAMIGLLGRVFFLALQTMANAIAMLIGFNSLSGSPIEETEPSGALTSMITFAATVLVFITDQHWEIFRAISASYQAMPVADGFTPQFGLRQLAATLGQAFFLSFRIASPFIIYSVTVNLAVGLMNKLTPQIPVYFISLPFVVAGGLALLYFTGGEILRVFMLGFSNWLGTG